MPQYPVHYVLWDEDREAIFSIYQRDPETGEIIGEQRRTGLPMDPEMNLVEKRYMQDIPENFVERFPNLLGVSHAEVDGDLVRMVYPDADYSEEAVRGELYRLVNEQANGILKESDWYIIRQFETGKGIPQEVLRRRQLVRDAVDDIVQQIDRTKGSALISFEWEFPEVEPYSQGAIRRQTERGERARDVRRFAPAPEEVFTDDAAGD